MLKIVTFKDLEFKVNFDFSDFDFGETLKSHRASAEFTDGTRVSVVCGFGTYSNGDTYEAFFSDEDEPRGYQTKTQLNSEFEKRSFPFHRPELIWKKIK